MIYVTRDTRVYGCLCMFMVDTWTLQVTIKKTLIIIVIIIMIMILIIMAKVLQCGPAQ